jgi:radical SAM superfamily enzyme YgiQ (UPF0313 family)
MNRKLIEKADFLVSREKGTIFKNPGGKINIALVYPNRYSVGMSSLGFQGIYGFLNSFHDVVCERVFLPDPEDLDEYVRTKTNLFSLESKRRLSEFDVIAFSVSFENDYPNVLNILKLSKIPLKSLERGGSHPLVMMGGVCAFYNPEPLADFMDMVFVGEAEEMLEEFIGIYRQTETREELFERAAEIEGLYVPRFYTVSYDERGRISARTASRNARGVIRKRSMKDISKSFFHSYIITPEAEFSDMYLVEAMRGCPWSCRFCVAGHIYKPVRKKDLDVLSVEIRSASPGARRVGLIGPSLSDYPHAEDVLKMEGVDFSITSLRASARSGRLVRLMKGLRSISIAPEAGTQRLRNVVNKKITDVDILETAKLILEGDVETLRLYFMVGLPTETMDDIRGIVELVREIRIQSKKGFIRLSVSTFVPKPFTPFQWHAMRPLKEIKEKLRFIKKELVPVRGVKVLHDVPKYAHLQGLFALGDRRVGGLVEKMASEGADILKQGVPGPDADFFIFREKDISENLPWDFIDAGIAKKDLWDEYQRALNT